MLPFPLYHVIIVVVVVVVVLMWQHVQQFLVSSVEGYIVTE